MTEGNGLEKFLKEEFIEFVKENTKSATMNAEILKNLSENIAMQIVTLQNINERLSKCEELSVMTHKSFSDANKLNGWVTKILIAFLILIVAKFLMLDVSSLGKILGFGG